MAAWTYTKAMKLLMIDEGGYSNHPRDPGGVTLNGVIQRVYDAWRKKNNMRQKPLTRSMLGSPVWERERNAIYGELYAAPVQYMALPAGLDYTVFDYAVNSGVGRAGKVLRRVLRMPDHTSRVTSEVLAEVRKRDPEAIITAINAERKAFVSRLSTCGTFCPGWYKRIARVLMNSRAFAKQRVPDVSPDIPESTTPRAQVPEPKASKGATQAGTATVGGAAGYGFWDWIAAHPIETAAIVISVVLLVSFVVHKINMRWKAKQEAPVPNTPYVPAVGEIK